MQLQPLVSGNNGLGRVLLRWCPSFERWTSTVADNVRDSQESVFASAKPFEEIPGDRSFPGIGTSWVLFPFIGKYSLSKGHLADQDKYKRFGDITRDKIGSLGIVSVFSPRDAETIFRNESQYPSRGEFTTLKAYREMRKEWYTTLGVMILQGKAWHDLRFKVQKNMMQPKIIEHYVEPMDNVALDFIQKIVHMRDNNNEVSDLIPELNKWALESVAYVGLDTRLGCLSPHLAPGSEGMKMIEAVQTTFSCMNELEAFAGNLPVWKWISTPKWREFVRAMDFFSETGFKYVNLSLENVRGDPKVNDGKELTLLQSMLSTGGLDASAAMTMVMDMLMAGIDTTSHTVGFLLYHLAKHPDKQERMYQEIKSFLPSPTDRITPEILKQIAYVKYCLKESMRLFPIVRGVARRIDHDIVLSGYKIPSGMIAAYMMQAACLLEENFKQADQYIPERWMDKANKPHPFAFIPFGVGIRSCIGRRLAEIEILCLAIEIIRKFKIEYHYEDIGIITRLINVPDRPLRLKLIDRE